MNYTKVLDIVKRTPKDWSRANNGGDYSFTGRVWHRKSDNKFVVEYRTSAEFQFCGNCGCFESNDDHFDRCEETAYDTPHEAVVSVRKRVF